MELHSITLVVVLYQLFAMLFPYLMKYSIVEGIRCLLINLYECVNKEKDIHSLVLLFENRNLSLTIYVYKELIYIVEYSLQCHYLAILNE